MRKMCKNKMFSVCVCIHVEVCLCVWMCVCVWVCMHARVCMYARMSVSHGRLLFLCPVFGRTLKHRPFVLGDSA